jgi:Cytochrome c3
MARALETVKEAEILRANPALTAKLGDYSYEIKRSGDQSIYTVTDGKDTIRVPLGWAFGLGSAGQTYLFERDGHWYESRVSYYSALRGLDVTMGAEGIRPRDLGEAAGRQSSLGDTGQCFDCHATQAVKGMQLTLDRMIPGIQCERCHGDSQGHPLSKPMRQLGKLTSEEISDFCGQCHRTWSQIAMNGPRGILNVRFQPYRLANSKCYSSDDRRIACTACHDPHRALETSVAAYDAKCQTCHSSPARTCSVAKKDCVTCHMPRLELPGSHKQFTDHLIRIVKANEKYPD